MSTRAMTAVRNDWSEPLRVRRTAVLSGGVSGGALANLASIGSLVMTDGTAISSETRLAAWPRTIVPPQTEVFAGYDAENLYLRVVCHEPEMQRICRDADEFWRNDHVAICVDPRHDHWRYLFITVLPDGRCEIRFQTTHYAYVPADLSPRPEPGPVSVPVRASQIAEGWTVEAAIPFDLLGIDVSAPGRCIGLNVSRWRTVGCEHVMEWSPTFGLPHDARCFGDVYLGRPAAELREICLGGPNWGPNQATAKFDLQGPIEVWIEEAGTVAPTTPQRVRLEPDARGQAQCRLDYHIDPRDIMAGALTLKWTSAAKPDRSGPISQASFIFGWKRSVLLTHVAGRHAEAPRPSDGSGPDFFERMCDYLLSRLPALRREGGRYLVDAAGGNLRIDLLGDDPLMSMARVLSERFESADDKLAAAALLLCQRDVLISSGTRAGVVYRSNPATMLWVGGTFCAGYSVVLCELIDRLAALENWNIRTGLVWLPNPPDSAHPWPNHWWGGAWLDRGVTILDAELGRFFYRRDGKTLATLDDLFADPDLAEAAGIGLGDYFRAFGPHDVRIKFRPHWREARPMGGASFSR